VLLNEKHRPNPAARLYRSDLRKGETLLLPLSRRKHLQRNLKLKRRKKKLIRLNSFPKHLLLWRMNPPNEVDEVPNVNRSFDALLLEKPLHPKLPLGIHHPSIRNVVYQLRRLDQILPLLLQRVDLDEDVKVAREQSAAEESAKEDDEVTPKAGEADDEEAEADEETEKEAKVEAEKDEEEEEERPATRTSRRTKSTAAPVEKEEEQDEDEEDEEEKPPPRTSRRGKDVETPVPEKAKEVEKKSTRRSSARGGKSVRNLQGRTDDPSGPSGRRREARDQRGAKGKDDQETASIQPEGIQSYQNDAQ
jgi:hypothetical protein